MIKLLWLVALACIAFRLLTGRWPWQFFTSKPVRRQELEHARRLLGVDTHASRKDILDAHRRVLTVVHPDRGGSNERVHEANAARDVLLKTLSSENRDA